MGLLDKVAAYLGYAKPTPARNNGFSGAQVSRLTASLATETQHINSMLRNQRRVLVARSRQVSQNNPYGKRFAQMVIDNVCGPVPFRMQAKVKFKDGKLDTTSNKKIEACWDSWSRKGNCEITGRWSWNALQRLLVRSLAVDGELLIRIMRGPQFGPHAFKLQMLDTDRLDDRKNEKLKGGSSINMGVEVDEINRPVAYHILKHLRSSTTWTVGDPREVERVPADDIIHFFIPEFAEQIRGVPWIYAALLNLVHIGAFAEAAVIAARIGASNMFVLKTPEGGVGLAGSEAKDAVTGAPTIQAEPGSSQMLPPGYELDPGWDPKFPDQSTGPFLKACLRGVSVGVNVAYHNLSGDMEGVNYSSARIAELDERDGWMTIQSCVSEHVHDALQPLWLDQQVMSGKLPFPDLGRLDRYREVYWQPRRWAWVDPAKEVKASLDAIDGKIKSRTRVIAEGGEDIEDVFGEISEEQDLAKSMNVELLPQKPTVQPGASNAEQTATVD